MEARPSSARGFPAPDGGGGNCKTRSIAHSGFGLVAIRRTLEIGEWRGALPPRALSEPDVNPNRASASSRASMQNDTSIVLDRRQLSTARLAQSITATR